MWLLKGWPAGLARQGVLVLQNHGVRAGANYVVALGAHLPLALADLVGSSSSDPFGGEPRTLDLQGHHRHR